MSDPIEEAQQVLIELETELCKCRSLWVQLQNDNPGFEQTSEENWQIKHARSWIHGATDLWESNAIETWLFDKPPLSDNAKEKASKCIKYWKIWLEQSNAYYGDFEDFEIEKPHKGEMLRDYLIRMADLVEKEGKGARLGWRALKSFLGYMRKIAPEEIAFIEQIFPKKMDIYFGKIIRIIAPEVYPIPQEVAGDIICELVRLATQGRPNGHLSALETLGQCWMCLTASRLRLPTYIEMIEKTKVIAISNNGEYPMMFVPTLFGARKIRISHRIAKFLLALSRIPSKHPRETILQSPIRSLRRTLDRAIENCALNPDLGNITFVTMLSPPHPFGKDHRYQPK